MRRYVSNRCKRLIIKKITDILSDKEQADLNEYMTFNSEAKKYFAELKRIWDETNTIVPANIFKTDVYDEWIKFIRFL